MYDTVHLVLDAPEWPDGFSLAGVPDSLDRAEETVSVETGATRYTGRLGRLRITATPSRLKVWGSLTNWYRDEGWAGEALTRADVADVRARLEARLGVDLGAAHVWRVDVFADLRLPSPVACYVPVLGERARFFRRVMGPASLVYHTARRQQAFYDKPAERKTAWADGGLLRYELRFLRALSEQVGGTLTFADLHAPAAWAMLVDWWEREYEAVAKARVLCAPTGPFKWQDHLAVTAGHAVGVDGYLRVLKAEQSNGYLTRSQYHTARRRFLAACQSPVLTAASGHADALDAAVRAAAAQIRAAG